MAQEDTARPVHVVEVLEATVGGTRRHVLQLLRGLRERGRAVTLVASAERDARFRKDMARLEAEGVRVIEVPMKRRLAPLSDLRALLRLRALFRSLPCDVVHTHASKAGALGRPAARWSGIRRIVHTPHTFHFQGRSGLLRWVFRGLERLLLRFTDLLIVVSDGQRLLAFEELGVAEDRVALIENGVDVSHFSRRGLRDEARHEMGIPQDAPAVGMIARLMRQKACDVFLRAAARVVEEAPETVFVLVGEGPLRRRLEKLAYRLYLADNLVWWDHVDDPRAFYEALDVFVLTSRYEGMPCSLLEAMAMGLPVVAPDIAGCREVVTEASGLLVPAGDAEACARAVIRLLSNPVLAQDMGAAARRHAVQRFDLTHSLDRTAALLSAAAKEPPDVLESSGANGHPE